MAFQCEPFKSTVQKCLRHGCTNRPTWRVATTKWWKLHDTNSNDGITGIVFEVCDDHLGQGWVRRVDIAL
jgi:hypothetical protein